MYADDVSDGARNGALAMLLESDRLEFERLFLYLRMCFLVAPALLVIAYGSGAVTPAVQAELAITVDCIGVAVLLRWYPTFALRAQFGIRCADLIVAYTAVHFAHFFLHNAYYDSVYIFVVVAATATHGRRGTILIGAASTVAVLLGRLQLMFDGVLQLEVRHFSDTVFYALLFFTTGAITDFLMKKSGDLVDLRSREARERVERSEARYRGLFENATDLVYEHDMEGHFTAMNAEGLRLLGYTDEDLGSLSLLDIVHPDSRDSAQDLMAGGESGEAERNRELALISADHSTIYVEISARMIRDSEGVCTVQGIARDITERKFMEDQLRHQALHDSLTGLPNRFLFEDRLHASVHSSRRSGEPVALLMVDFDRFKSVNDTYGHAAGDALLRTKAAKISAMLRESDTFARLGGDEFACLLPATDATGAMLVARMLVETVKEPVSAGGHVFDVGASVGVSIYPDIASDVSVLQDQADRAMYLAKRGRAGFALATTDLEVMPVEPMPV